MLLEVKDLVKQYRNGVRANDGLDLSVEKGEVFGLLGPNGAGKTTLINQVIGLTAPTSGSITLNGQDVVANPGYSREVCSFQPQGTVPIDGFTPMQAIGLIGQMRGGSKQEVRQNAERLVESLNIEEWADKQGQGLSGGVRRLVGFCMAAVHPGQLVVLDEPTNDVDPLRRRLLWDAVKRLADNGSAVVLVTHNVLEAERVVDRLAIIDEGKVKLSGTPSSLKGGKEGNLRLELVLEPGAELERVPDFLEGITVGHKYIGSVAGDRVAAAVEWARAMQEEGLAEEFSVAPSSLEDAYVRIVGTRGTGESGEPGPE